MIAEEKNSRHLYIATFGCQMNEYDSMCMTRLMDRENYVLTDTMDEADLILLNTCCIREKAEQKVYSFLGRLRKLKEKKPELVIGVTGCVAQQEGARLFRKAPYLDLVVGTHGVLRLPELVEKVSRTGKKECQIGFEHRPAPPLDFNGDPAPLTAFVTIMQGCDNYCSYCVVPYVRGREVSRRPEDILAEIKNLLDRGTREITLLGQNVNSYGRGLGPGISFAALLHQAASLEDLDRLRFTTSHPKDLSSDLIKALAELGPLCEHIHLPVQSGSNKVLKAMNRKYTREDYLEKVDRLRHACPEIAITTDVIVGFPGETEDDFQQTVDLITQVRFDGAFSFQYSDRPMTRATRFDNKIGSDVKRERLIILQALQKEITLEINRGMIGRRFEVLLEGLSKRGADQLMGRTRTNKIVNVSTVHDVSGALAEVLVEEAFANSLRGTIVTDQFAEAGLV